MKTPSSPTLALLLNKIESQTEIPSSEECRPQSRIRVAFQRLHHCVIHEDIWDAVYVDCTGLLLVEKWHRVADATEESPSTGTIFVSDGRNHLTKIEGDTYVLTKEL